MKRTFKFDRFCTGDQFAMRTRALVNCIDDWDGDCEVSVADAKRNTDQNAALHAALADVAKQVVWHGQSLPAGVWKRLCVAAWLRERGERPVMVPALDGIGVDVIYERTSQLSKKDCASLIDWVMAFGAENGVKFTTTEEPW